MMISRGASGIIHVQNRNALDKLHVVWRRMTAVILASSNTYSQRYCQTTLDFQLEQPKVCFVSLFAVH